jgi:hypothetical protein
MRALSHLRPAYMAASLCCSALTFRTLRRGTFLSNKGGPLTTVHFSGYDAKRRPDLPWTPEDTPRLVGMRAKRITWKDIVSHFHGRTLGAIRSKYYKSAAPRNKFTRPIKKLSPDDRQKIIELHEKGETWEQISAQLPDQPHWRSIKRAWSSNQSMKGDLGPKSWTDKELKLLVSLRMRKLWTWGAIAKKLGRSIGGVSKRFNLHLDVENKAKYLTIINSRRYTPTEDERMLLLGDAGLSCTKIAAYLPGRSARSVNNRLRLLRRRSGRPVRYKDPKLQQLRQELIDLRARKIPWKDIFPRYPNIRPSCLKDNFWRARTTGVKPSTISVDRAKEE